MSKMKCNRKIDFACLFRNPCQKYFKLHLHQISVSYWWKR